MSQDPAVPKRDHRVNLYDLPPHLLRSALTEFVSPPFRIRQVEEWLYHKGVTSFDAMTNLPVASRAELATHFALEFPAVKEQTEPSPDGSVKYLLTLADGSLIEAVYMPMAERTTICLSSQAGCAVGCTFCVTGFFGPGRNISPAEIVGQYRIVQREHDLAPEKTNLVFMGMGEPLLNFENLATSLEIFEHEMSLKRVTVSTAGIIPGIEDLANLPSRPNLAVSINAPDRARREEVMPITKKYPLDALMAALRRFPLEKGRSLTMEYVLLAGYNDAARDARMLADLVRGIHCKVNVIPFNPDPHLPDWMKRPTDFAIDRFVKELTDRGASVTVRRSKGRDISAACGQLRGQTERRRRTVR